MTKRTSAPIGTLQTDQPNQPNLLTNGQEGEVTHYPIEITLSFRIFPYLRKNSCRVMSCNQMLNSVRHCSHLHLKKSIKVTIHTWEISKKDIMGQNF